MQKDYENAPDHGQLNPWVLQIHNFYQTFNSTQKVQKNDLTETIDVFTL